MSNTKGKSSGPARKPQGKGAEVGREPPAGDVEILLSKHLDELEDLVREHPLATIGIAVGFGLVAGLLLSAQWGRR